MLLMALSLTAIERSFTPEKVPIPKELERLKLPFPQPLDVEIGAGTGEHAIAYCRNNRQRHLLAIEKTKERFQKFSAKLENESFNNLTSVHGNAIPWITHALRPGSVERYFIFYPNPYPKLRQANKRFYRMPFMSKLIETMKTNATLTITSNVKSHIEEARLILNTAWGMKITSNKSIDPNSRFQPRSLFEKKYLARGEHCYELVCTKLN